MKDWQNILFGTFLGLACAAVIVMVAQPPRGEPILIPPPDTPAPMIVHVSGAVNSPGLVTLNQDNRVSNAIEKAGGFTQDADQSAINLAAIIHDGDKIAIPSLREQATQAVINSTKTSLGTKSSATGIPLPSFPININTATQLELQDLPNIGPSKAADIIEYRELHGPFGKIEDLENVPNIGPATLEKIRDFIAISG